MNSFVPFFKDYVGNKRLELSGQLISLLFEVCLAVFCGLMVGSLNHMHTQTHKYIFSPTVLIFQDLFKTMIAEVRKSVDFILSKPSRSSRFDFSQVSAANNYLKRIQNENLTGNLTSPCFS